MKYPIGKACLIILSMALMTGAPLAYEHNTDATGKAAVSGAKPTVSAKPAHNSKTGKPKNAGKWVDINNASKAQLKTLPRIDDALADKIIAGRPYKSKAFLLTNKIIPAGAYVAIKDQVIAKQK
jgi:competence protein ComEA